MPSSTSFLQPKLCRRLCQKSIACPENHTNSQSTRATRFLAYTNIQQRAYTSTHTQKSFLPNHAQTTVSFCALGRFSARKSFPARQKPEHACRYQELSFSHRIRVAHGQQKTHAVSTYYGVAHLGYVGVCFPASEGHELGCLRTVRVCFVFGYLYSDVCVRVNCVRVFGEGTEATRLNEMIWSRDRIRKLRVTKAARFFLVGGGWASACRGLYLFCSNDGYWSVESKTDRSSSSDRSCSLSC